jgi:two-component system LytT family response regulator
MSLSCIIIDDEQGAHVILRKYISKLTDLKLLANCFNAIEAHNFLTSNHLDLIFLDINMPEIDGFSLLEMLDPRPMVIITTAYTDHAFKSYDFNVVDYLHKPISFQRFALAIQKAKTWTKIHNVAVINKSLEVITNKQKLQINVDEIEYIESLGNYIRIFWKHPIICHMSTKHIEEQLPQNFVRIHKSFIVNLNYIKSIKNLKVHTNNTTLPVGQSYKINLNKTYKSHFGN